MAKETIVDVVKKVVPVVKASGLTKIEVAKLELERMRRTNQRLLLSNGRRVSEQAAYLQGLIEGLEQ